MVFGIWYYCPVMRATQWRLRNTTWWQHSGGLPILWAIW